MAHANHEEERDLPQVWPFSLAGVLLIVALSWFCLGFAIADRKPIDTSAKVEGPIKLAHHYTVFWGLLAAGLALVILGTVINMVRRRRLEH
jgi:hypothetical protein